MNNNPKEGDLRVWWIPNLPSNNPMTVKVKTPEEAALVLTTLANYDLYLIAAEEMEDISGNAGGLEVWENGEWCEWAGEEYDADIWELVEELYGDAGENEDE